MIKRIYQMIFILLFAVSGVMAQTVVIPHDDYAPGDILVPVEMNGFTDVAAITLVIEYDSDLLSFVSIENTAFLGAWTANYNQNEDKLFIQYFNFQSGGHTINGKLLDIKFSYIGGFSSPVTFDVDLCEISNDNMQPIPGITYTNGSVNQLGSDGDLTLGSGIFSIGNPITIPVGISGAGFGAVDAITLKIAYDPAKLVYTGKTDVSIGNGVGIVTAVASNGMLSITWTGPAQNFTSAATLLNLHFTYHGGLADLEFYPGSEISSNLAPHPVTYFDGLVEPAVEDKSLTIGEAGCKPGELVSVPIIADGFGGSLVGAITLNVQYDNSLLVYTGFTINQLPGSIYWTVLGLGDGTINITYSRHNNTSLIADGNLITLHFATDETGDGGIAPVVFLPGNEVTSVALVNLPVSYYDGFVVIGYSLEGYIYYDGDTDKPLYNSTAQLLDGEGNVLFAANTDGDGYYVFPYVPGGDYTLTAITDLAWGGADYDDALDVFLYQGGQPNPIVSALQMLAADVDEDGDITYDDALTIFFWTEIVDPAEAGWEAPEWIFEVTPVTITDDTLINFSGICSGDANSSYTP